MCTIIVLFSAIDSLVIRSVNLGQASAQKCDKIGTVARGSGHDVP
jgi:hypothetical protein